MITSQLTNYKRSRSKSDQDHSAT